MALVEGQGAPDGGGSDGWDATQARPARPALRRLSVLVGGARLHAVDGEGHAESPCPGGSLVVVGRTGRFGSVGGSFGNVPGLSASSRVSAGPGISGVTPVVELPDRDRRCANISDGGRATGCVARAVPGLVGHRPWSGRGHGAAIRDDRAPVP